eukprot:COSAG01_NODE_50211_length_365_cov_0.778195_1_plen_44_part_10
MHSERAGWRRAPADRRLPRASQDVHHWIVPLQRDELVRAVLQGA